MCLCCIVCVYVAWHVCLCCIMCVYVPACVSMLHHVYLCCIMCVYVASYVLMLHRVCLCRGHRHPHPYATALYGHRCHRRLLPRHEGRSGWRNNDDQLVKLFPSVLKPSFHRFALYIMLCAPFKGAISRDMSFLVSLCL